MKKVAICLMAIFLLASVAFAAETEIPAPFAKAKELALQAQPNIYGGYILNFEINENGITTIYVLAYLSQLNMIGIGTLEPNYLVYEYNEKTGEFSIYDEGVRRESAKKEVSDGAFKIFRILVLKNLI